MDLFLNFCLHQDFQVPVCPLCNKAVPVPRGEQPDIKVMQLCFFFPNLISFQMIDLNLTMIIYRKTMLHFFWMFRGKLGF